MTPEDLDAIRAETSEFEWGYAYPVRDKILALADALEQAWSERDAAKECESLQRLSADRLLRKAQESATWEAAVGDWKRVATEWRERAERAEASLDFERAEYRMNYEAKCSAEAALARVRAVCDTGDEPFQGNSVRTWEIRAAIEGDQQ